MVIKICPVCNKPHKGTGKFHDSCRQEGYRRARAVSHARAQKRAAEGRKMTEPAKKKKSEQQEKPRLMTNEDQRKIDDAVREKQKLELEEKLYKPGTPEFQELAELYMAREKARNPPPSNSQPRK